MSSRILDELNNVGNFTYLSRCYFGIIDDYDVIIKYDTASMLYSMQYCVQGKEDINLLNKELAKIDKFAVARYKKTNLIIMEACNNIKEMPEMVSKIAPIISNYLKKNKYKKACFNCNKVAETELVNIDGRLSFYCDNCYKDAEKQFKKDEKSYDKLEERPIKGFLGALIGTIPGIIAYIFLSYFNINQALAALIIMLGSAYGYRWLGKSMKLKGIILSILAGVLATLIANEISFAHKLFANYNNIYDINLFQAYKAIPYYLSNSTAFHKSYMEDLIIALIFAGFGSFSNFSIYRKYIAKNKIGKVGIKNDKTN